MVSMENQYFSLLKVYKVQILSRSLHRINFLFLSQTKMQNMDNFALVVAFCIGSKSNTLLFIHLEFLYTFCI